MLQKENTDKELGVELLLTNENGVIKENQSKNSKEAPKEIKETHYWNEVRIAILACTCIFANGTQQGWAGPSLPKLLAKTAEIRIVSQQAPLVAGLYNIGYVPGALFGTFICDRFGRKKSIVFGTFPHMISTLMLIFATSVADIYTARFMGGFAAGVYFVTIPLYINEISSPKVRGLLGVIIGISLNSGILLQFAIAPFLTIKHDAVVCFLLPVISILCIRWIPESPYYFVMRKNYTAARISLQRLRQSNDIENELNRLIEGDEILSKTNKSYLDLFKNSTNRKALLIISTLFVIQQFGGFYALLVYSQIIMQDAKVQLSIDLCGVVLILVNVFASVLCSWLIEYFGRRTLLVWSCATLVVPLSFVGIYFHLQTYQYQVVSVSFLVVVSLMSIKIILAVGIENVPFIYVGELFPTNVRAGSYFMKMVLMSLLGFLALKQYQLTTDSFGVHVSFYIFIGINLIGVVFTKYCTPETKGKTLEEIQIGLQSKSSKSRSCCAPI